MTADRRTFLAASALAAAAPLATAADDKPISVGFVGVGNRGSALLTAC